MTNVTIAARVRELDQSRAAQPANEVMSVFGRERETLAAQAPEGVVALGTKLPDVELLDVHGEGVSLHTTLAGRPSVLVFYRGAWCPYCNIALNAYQTGLLPELADRGVGLIAVSPQTPDGSLGIEEKHDLRFAVVSDPGNVLAASIGIVTAPSDEALAAQLELGLDLKAVNADGTTAIPQATTVILDSDATVRWVDVHADYSTRSEPAAILAALDDLSDR
jgi:peroxiredoxin